MHPNFHFYYEVSSKKLAGNSELKNLHAFCRQKSRNIAFLFRSLGTVVWRFVSCTTIHDELHRLIWYQLVGGNEWRVQDIGSLKCGYEERCSMCWYTFWNLGWMIKPLCSWHHGTWHLRIPRRILLFTCNSEWIGNHTTSSLKNVIL